MTVGWMLGALLGEPAAPIVNGETLRDEHREVVALAGVDVDTGEAWVFCTGSQVQTSWILTAAHCIDEGATWLEQGLELAVLWGGDLQTDGATDLRFWASSQVEPGWLDGVALADIALIELESPKSDNPWVVLSDTPMEGSEGAMVTFYGFGVTSELAGDEGTKRSTQVPIVAIEALEFEAFDPSTNLCFGDSGGPSTVQGVDGPEQVGVNTWVRPACVGGRSGSVRVDAHLDWILSVVPDVALDAADLPDLSVTGRDWDDLGVVDDLDGQGGSWAHREGEPAPGGCATVPGAAGWGLGLASLLGRRRVARQGGSRGCGECSGAALAGL